MEKKRPSSIIFAAQRRRWAAAGAALILLIVMNALRVKLKSAALESRRQAKSLAQNLEDAQDALADAQSLRDMKEDELSRAKRVILSLTRSRQALYESGLELQEEDRILQKQWEMLSTYLQVDLESGRISVMRSGQALESYPVRYSPPRAFGGEDKPLPRIVRIISKERYAAPERGKSEEVNGHLEWQPPEVGTSARASALGEFVMFTDSPLILHGPPKNAADHAAYPHDCLGLSWPVARRLYRESFVGEKIWIAGEPKPARAAAPTPAGRARAQLKRRRKRHGSK
ncbi:MAG TPA: L,D-transpeptidase [Elusimicrobiota bacterium]|nr:L,D-transpeptidase [Elusimicrobiota bacterium]